MLFDPLEEQFNSPSIFIKESDCFSSYRQVVRVEDKSAGAFNIIEHDPAEDLGITLMGKVSRKLNQLVGKYPGIRVVVILVFHNIETHIPFLTNHEVGSYLVDGKKIEQCHICTIKDIICA